MMKIAVVGASGFVGAQVVAEALARGHQVDAYTLSGATIPGAASSQVLDLSDSSGLAEVINTHDFTVIAVANRKDYPAVIAAHQDLIAAAPEGRFLVVGGAGSLEVAGVSLHETPGFPESYKAEAETFATVLNEYLSKAGNLEWTMLSPSPELADGQRTGHYILGEDSPVGDYVSTQDLAVAILDEAEKPAHVKRRFTVASSKV